MFHGVYTALVTPFRDGSLDLEALAGLVEQQARAGIHGLVPCGTTGEASTLSEEERLAVIEATVRASDGRMKVVAGVGTNDTAQTIRLAAASKALGADGALVITPYYNKPTQEGLYHHCRAVAEGVSGLPLMLYNVPSRCSVSFDVDTLDRLADVPGVVAVKEATADMVFDAALLAKVQGRMAVLSGDDHTAFPLWALGGVGLVSVCSNLLPGRMMALWRAFAAGDLAEARRLHLQLFPLFQALFWETNPGPIKALMAWMGRGIQPEMRLPLVMPRPGTVTRLQALMTSLELTDAA